ncbi:hypothetical protein AUJ46_03610 [Candidatus Peregrinibacteria bacterium CG1_02_54_53]|nr:MAG: hypothetical protein AUJ46_03610 [Candidatus Peregrinibacteria bacterium CG1_02_54_53]
MEQSNVLLAVSLAPRARWIAIGVIVLVTLVTYAPSLGNGFVSIDDPLLITKNANVLHMTPQTIWANFTTFDPELYVPLTLTTYQIEVALFGLRPFIFHFTNLLLHIGTALLLFAVAYRFAQIFSLSKAAYSIALFCALAFALHPLNTEAVVWAAARKDVLSTFLFFASLLLFLLFREDGSRRLFIWSIVCFFFALLAKVSVLMLPFVLLLVDVTERKYFSRNVWREKIPFFFLALCFGLIALLGKQTQLTSLNIFEKGWLACKATAFYLWALVWPMGLTIFHPQEVPIAPSHADLWVPLLVVILMMVVAAISYRRKRLFFFGISFCLLLLLPSFMTFWKNGFVYFASERYAYVPMVGIIFALGATIFPRFQSIVRGRLIRLGVAMLLVVTLGGLSVRQSFTWRDSRALYERVLAVYPQSAQALNNLGSINFEAEQYHEALTYFDRALAADPALPSAHANRGQTLRQLGDNDGALRAFAQGIASLPEDRPSLPQDLAPFLDLSQLLDAMGRSEEAVQVLRGAIQRLPRAPLPHYYLGIKEQQFSRFEEARTQFLLTTELDPRMTDAFYRLAAVSAELGQLSEAVSALEHVLQLDPGNKTAREHLQNIQDLQRQ